MTALASAAALAWKEAAFAIACRALAGVGTGLTFVSGSDYVRTTIGTAVAQGVSILAAGSHGAYRIAMLKSSAVLDLYTELRTLAAALNAAGIPYGLAGGLAVSLYTTPRATEDIDVLVAAADVDRVVHVAAPLGFRKSGRRIRRANGRIEIQRLVKIDGADLLPLDLMVIVDPGLRDAVQGRTEKVIEDQRLSVVSVDALVVLKRLRNSNRDLGDLDALRDAGLTRD